MDVFKVVGQTKLCFERHYVRISVDPAVEPGTLLCFFSLNRASVCGVLRAVATPGRQDFGD